MLNNESLILDDEEFNNSEVSLILGAECWILNDEDSSDPRVCLILDDKPLVSFFK